MFENRTSDFPGAWNMITDPADLSAAKVQALKPRYIFFPHWSWIVPSTILHTVECVCFHMTDVPYGRGGSPLQNLIVRGHSQTMLTALKMTEELDAGPVYLKRPLSLAGTAQEIFVRASKLAFDMIEEIVKTEPKTEPQVGKPVVFERRTAVQSQLPSGESIENLYDHIRMLDAETYDHAFVENDFYHIELHDAKISGNTVTATAVLRLKGGKDG
jgi:methionyl-tRNA formyltransferase